MSDRNGRIAMLTKIYFMLWAFIIFVAFGMFITGLMTPTGAVVFGFIAFGMTFMGMMSVLPTAVHDQLVKH
jgi:hypothetical protein